MLKKVLDIISEGGVKGIAHITGGGFTDNIPRVFPKGLGATIYRDSWEVPAVFKWIQEVTSNCLSNLKILHNPHSTNHCYQFTFDLKYTKIWALALT